jgi:hypothetical protein
LIFGPGLSFCGTQGILLMQHAELLSQTSLETGRLNARMVTVLMHCSMPWQPLIL